MASGGSSVSVTLYTDAACTQAATVQQVIDAFSAGDVRILQTVNSAEGSTEVVTTVLSLGYRSVSGSGPVASLLVADPKNKAIKALNLAG